MNSSNTPLQAPPRPPRPPRVIERDPDKEEEVQEVKKSELEALRMTVIQLQSSIAVLRQMLDMIVSSQRLSCWCQSSSHP